VTFGEVDYSERYEGIMVISCKRPINPILAFAPKQCRGELTSKAESQLDFSFMAMRRRRGAERCPLNSRWATNMEASTRKLSRLLHPEANPILTNRSS